MLCVECNTFKMERLPNELLIECFKYLDGLHIFQSFDGLNTRLSILIRRIPLYIDFRTISTSNLRDICMKLISSSDINKQIYSLKLTSNNPFQKQLLEHEFNFIHLRSLSFIDLDQSKLNINFSKLSHLHCYHQFRMNKILSALPVSQIRILTLQELNSSHNFSTILSSITNLRICKCNDDIIHDILTYGTKLIYLRLDIVHSNVLKRKSMTTLRDLQQNHPSTSLKQLKIIGFSSDFETLTNLLKRTINLEILTLVYYHDDKLFRVNDWQYFIHSTLIKLKKFNFICKYINTIEHKQIRQVFQQFQNDFWLNEYKWYTECTLSNDFSTIYTIPYIHNSYTLESFSDQFFNSTIDRRNIYANVNYVKFNADIITNQYAYYFPYVKTLSIDNCCLNRNYFDLLKTIVNLTNLNELHILSKCQLDDSSILLDIVKQSSNLSMLNIDSRMLRLLFVNHELCKYLSKIIRKLTLIAACDANEEFDQMNKFWQTFENLEELDCTIEKRQSIRLILESLPRLSHLNIRLKTARIVKDLETFTKEIATKLGVNIFIESEADFRVCLDVWIARIC